MKTPCRALAFVFLLAAAGLGQAQTTAFTYQGRFNTNGTPYTGSVEFQFILWDAASGGSAVATNNPASVMASVDNGLFTATLDFGLAPFNGQPRFLQIEARTAIGPFATLNPRQPVTATPYALRALNVQPGGLPAGSYGNAVIFNNAANEFSGAFIGTGAGLTDLNASQLSGGTVPAAALSNAWKTAGNADTTPEVHFLGTTDNQPLEMRVNNLRVLRLEASTNNLVNILVAPNRNSIASNLTSAGVLAGAFNHIRTNSSASVIAGGQGNVISNASGGTIAGGTANFARGFVATVGGGAGNFAGGDRSTVPGGSANQAIGDSTFVGGGSFNSAENLRAVVVGGDHNRNLGIEAFIGGGQSNTVSGTAATLGGGELNVIQSSGSYATIPGGRENFAGGAYAFAAGHRARANHTGAFVWADSTDADFDSTADNQFNVRASGGARFMTGGGGISLDGQPVLAGTIGSGNLADSSVLNSKLADSSVNSAKIIDGSVQAGDVNAATFNTTFWRAGGNAGTTAGAHFLGTTDNEPVEIKANGVRVARFEPAANDAFNSNNVNIVQGSSVNFAATGVKGATISGGGAARYSVSSYTNRVLGDFGTVGGGLGNSASNDMATVGGGQQNLATGFSSVVSGGQFNSAGRGYSTVGGGQNNIAGGFGATISGGQDNNASGLHATVPGGSQNIANADYSFAAGRLAWANHQGAFVWADSQLAIFGSTISNQFRVRAQGGMEVVGGTNAETLKISASRAGDFNAPIGLAMNNNTIGASSPALRVVNAGGNSAEGALSVSTAGTGLIARFGNASTFVSSLAVNGTWSALAFNPTSDRQAKENFTPVNPRDVLDKVTALPLARWNYKAAPGLEHLGPVAQDFHAAFGLNGADDKHIATVDADGVALAAIQGLNQKLEEQNAELKQKETEITKLQQRLEALEKIVLNQKPNQE